MSENLNETSCRLGEELVRDNEEGQTGCSSVKSMLIGGWGSVLFLCRDKLSQHLFSCVASIRSYVKWNTGEFSVTTVFLISLLFA
jgi:hypothetical protein